MANNSTSAQSSSTIYQIYGEDKFSVSLASIFIVKCIITTGCLLTNADLVYITLKNKNLRTSCNKLIAICSFFTAVDMMSTFVPFFLTVTGKNFMLLYLCTLIQIPTGFSHVFAVNMSFFIAFDCLLAILFPIWYGIRDKTSQFYVLFVCGICSIVPLAVVGITIGEMFYLPYTKVLCTLADPLGRFAFYVQIMQLSFESMGAICYLLILIAIKVRKSYKKNVEMSIIKSLACILVLELVGWVQQYGLRVFLVPFNVNPITYWYIINIDTYIPYTCWALTPFILYRGAKDYRAAFMKRFGVAQTSLFTTRRVAPLSISNNNNLSNRSAGNNIPTI